MLHVLREGDRVKIWPAPGHSVPLSPPVILETADGKQSVMPSRNLDPKGEEVVWSLWLHDHARGGALLFSDPHSGGGMREAQHVRHPHEVGPDGKPAHESGALSEHELAHWEALGHKGAKLSEAVTAAPEVG